MADVVPPIAKLLPLKIFDKLVPCRRVRVRGGMRDHEHVYPHSPGAGVELLGRDLYKIEVTPIFDARLIPEKYHNLWPAGLKELRDKFDIGFRGPIQIPTVGVLTAYCKTWEQEFDATRSLSGEEVIWHFTEDSDALRLSSLVLSFGNSLALAKDDLNRRFEGLAPKERGLWDSLFKLVDDVLAIRDQFNLYSNIIESKMLSILSIIQQLDNAADELRDPSNWALVQAFQNVWTQARVFYEDQQQLGVTVKYYTTKQILSCVQLAIILFDDASKSSDLLQLNGFADPFAIPAGTRVKYYQVS
jgi:hypothetical protein